MPGKFPGPYVNDVTPTDGGTDGMMEYTHFPVLGIGARKSGMPANASEGPNSLEHVGGSQGAAGKHRGTNPGR
jgi:hypothetical protein